MVENSSRFKKGCIPWNKGKSVRLNPRTEFKKGNSPPQHKGGCKCFRCSKKSVNKGKFGNKAPRWKGGTKEYYGLVARRLIEKHYNKSWNQLYKPGDAVIHHIDGNCKNNIVDNLCVVSRADHMRIHKQLGDLN